MRRSMALANLALCVFAFACVPPQPEDPNAISPSAPQPLPPTGSVVASDTPSALPTATSAPSPNDTTMVPMTVDVHNDCTDSVPLFLGEKPKFGSGTKTSVSANSTTSFPRDSDGTVTIWIIDEQENGLASVHVTKRMKKVEIGRSCRTLDAH